MSNIRRLPLISNLPGTVPSRVASAGAASRHRTSRRRGGLRTPRRRTARRAGVSRRTARAAANLNRTIRSGKDRGEPGARPGHRPPVLPPPDWTTSVRDSPALRRGSWLS